MFLVKVYLQTAAVIRNILHPLACHLFCAHCQSRWQVKQENPGIAFGEVGKVLGEMWRQAGAEEKEKYAGMAARDKERYDQEMGEYRARQAGADAE